MAFCHAEAMITKQGRLVVGVRYEMVFKGKVIDVISTGGKGGILDLIAAVDRNPGMIILAEIYEIPRVREPEVVVSRRQVYPPLDSQHGDTR